LKKNINKNRKGKEIQYKKRREKSYKRDKKRYQSVHYWRPS
jgi:hypothetical protein